MEVSGLSFKDFNIAPYLDYDQNEILKTFLGYRNSSISLVNSLKV